MPASIRSTVTAAAAMTLALAACTGATSDDSSSTSDTELLAMVTETTSIDEQASPGDSSGGDGVEAEPVSQTMALTTVSDVATACEGTTFSNLAPDIAVPSKIAFVQNYQNAEGTFALATDVSLEDAQYDYVGGDLLNLDYVGCIVEVSRDRSELECALTAEDGSVGVIEAYDLNLAVRIVDAATGAEVAVEPIAATLDECPTELPADAVLLAPIDGDGLRLATESHLAR